MSPAELRHVRHRRRPLGYRRRDVDTTMERTVVAYEEVWRDRADLQETVHRLEAEVERHREVEDVLRRTLMAAEQSASEMREAARREAARIVREAEQRAREILGEAQAGRDAVRHSVLLIEEQERELRARLRTLLHVAGGVLDDYERERLAGERMPAA
jgi:cell division initiation protein